MIAVFFISITFEKKNWEKSAVGKDKRTRGRVGAEIIHYLADVYQYIHNQDANISKTFFCMCDIRH